MKIKYAKINYNCGITQSTTADLPEASFIIANPEDLQPNQTWGLFRYEVQDQYAYFITAKEVKK